MNPLKLREAFKLVILSQARKHSGRCRDLTGGAYVLRDKAKRKSRPQSRKFAVAAKAVAGMNLRAGGSNPLGDTILENFLKPLDMTTYRLAKELHVPVNRMTAIVNGERAITVETAMRLSKFFGTTVEFWLRLQNAYDMSVTKVDLSEITPCRETATQ
ncbi:HigA family addiction module antitoxin [Terasakiella brassicae]|nr:HigA family addiction module antitoxin [Terasakiella brassicae]